jgi:hypothetical protein
MIVEALAEDVGHERDLRVVPRLRADAGRFTQGRASAVRSDRKTRLDARRTFRRALVSDALMVAFESHRLHARRRDHPDLLLAEATPERRAHRAVGDDEAERREPLLLRIEAREAEAALVRDVNPADRGRLAFDQRPHSQRPEDAATPVRERCRTVIEARLGCRTERSGLEQRDVQPDLREREREARPDEPAPCDCNIDCGGRTRGTHAFISFSIASGSFASPAVRTSLPSRVTATSSSMRTPMFHQRLATPRVPAGM